MGDPGERNVDQQRRDPRSLLTLYHRLMALRRNEPALYGGEQHPVRSRNDILVYRRTAGAGEFLIGLNLAAEPRRWTWPEPGEGWLCLSTHLDRAQTPVSSPLMLRANEGVIVRLSQAARNGTAP